METQVELAREIMAKFDSQDEFGTCKFFIESTRGLGEIFSPISKDGQLEAYINQVLEPASEAVEERLGNASLLTIGAMIKLYPLINVLSKLLAGTIDSVKDRETLSVHRTFLDVIIGQWFMGTLLELTEDDE